MDVPQAAERRVWLLRGLTFSQACLVVLGRVVAYTWLLQSAGSAKLPLVYLGQALLIGLLTLGVFGLVDRVGRASLLVGMFLVFGAVVALASATPEGWSAYAAPAFLLFVESGIAIVGTHFWLLASELLSPEQSRRAFPSFTLTGGLGAVAGGFAAHLAPLLGLRSMTAMLALPALACAALAAHAHRRYGYRVGARADAERASFVAELSSGLALMKGSRLVKWVGLLTALVTCCGLTVDCLFALSVARTCERGALAGFLGNTNLAVSVVQLAVVVTLGSRLFTTFGLFRTFWSYPLGAGAAALSGVPFGPAASPVLLKIFDRLENYLILNPGLGIALAAFPRDRRGRASFVYGGLVKPLAMAGTGLTLLSLKTNPAALWPLLAFGLVVFFPLLQHLATVYRETLLENLRTSDARLVAGSIEALAEPENRAVVPRLLELVEKSDDPALAENVLRAAGSIGDPRFVPLLLKALSSSNSSMKIAAAGSLKRFEGPEVQQALLEAIRGEQSGRAKASMMAALGSGQQTLYPVLRAGLTDPEARVRANAVEAIGLSGDRELIGELRPLLDSVSPRELANVIVALSRVPTWRPDAKTALHRIFDSGDRTLLASALWAAGELGDGALLPTLRSLMEDADAMVRRNAVIALGKLDEPGMIEPMVKLLLGPPDDAMAMARAVARLSVKEREDLLMRLSRLPRPERALVVKAFTQCGVNYPDELYQLR